MQKFKSLLEKRESIQQLKSELDLGNTINREYEKRIRAVEQKLAKDQLKLLALQGQIEKERGRRKGLEEDKAALDNEAKELDTCVQELDFKIKDTAIFTNSVGKNVEESRKQIEVLKIKKQELSEVFKTSESSLDKSAETRQELHNQITELKNQIEASQKLCVEKESELSQLVLSIESSGRTKAVLVSVNKELEAKQNLLCSDQETKKQEREAINNQIYTLKQKKTELEENCKEKEMVLAEVVNTISSMRREAHTNEKTNMALFSELQRMDKEIQTKKQVCDDEGTQLESKKTQQARLSRELSESRKKIEQYDQLITATSSESASLAEQIDVSKKELTELEKLKTQRFSEMEDSNSQKQKSEQTLQLHDETIHKTRQEIEAHEVTITELDRTRIRLSKEIEDREAQTKDFVQAKNKAEINITEIQDALLAKKVKNQELDFSLDSIKMQCDAFQENEKELLEKLNQYESAVELTMRSLDAYKKKHKDLNTKIEMINTAIQERDTEVARLRNKKQEIDQQITPLEKAHKDLEVMLTEKGSVISTLHNQIQENEEVLKLQRLGLEGKRRELMEKDREAFHMQNRLIDQKANKERNISEMKGLQAGQRRPRRNTPDI